MLPDINIDVAAIQQELGLSGPILDFSSNVLYNALNKWSFYSPQILSVDAGTKQIVAAPPSSPYIIGDYRGYDHSAGTPRLDTTSLSMQYFPGDTSIDIAVAIMHEQCNLLALGQSVTHVKVKVYSNAARTNFITEKLVAIPTYAITAKPDHSRDQTQRANSIQVVTEITISTPSLYPNIYWSVWLCVSTGVEICHYDVWQGSGTLSVYVMPVIRSVALIQAGALPAGNSPAGFPWSVTGSRLQTYTAATPKEAAASVPQALGTSYSFYWTIVLMDTMGNDYCAGVTSITLRGYEGSNQNDQLFESAASHVDPTSQKQETGTLSAGSFSADDIWSIYYDTGIGIVWNSVYSEIL